MRFHIHFVANGERVIDEEGNDFPDVGAAKNEAVASAREIMAEQLRAGHIIAADWSVVITDARGDTVDTMSMQGIALGADGTKPPPRNY